MTQASDLQNISMSVGEVKGQMREVVHAVNNLTQEVRAIASKVDTNANLPHQVAEIDARVTALEADKNKRDGAMGFGGWFLKSPLIGWIATTAAVLWAFLHGRHT